MAAMSDYLENKIIDQLFRGVSYSFPSTVYIALCTSATTDSQTGSTITEVSGGDYTRKSVSCGTGTFTDTSGGTAGTSSGTGGTTSNVTAVTWTSVTWSATVTHVATWGASTAGNVL